MKKFIFVMFLGLLSCSFLVAQSLQNGMWQCQNPTNPDNSEMLIFGKEKVSLGSINLVTGQKSQSEEAYRLYGNTLTIYSGDQEFSFELIWINKNKFALKTANGGYLYYGQITTIEDQFMVNYLNRRNSGGGGVYPQPSQTQQPCWPCNGTGRCKVCDGKGKIGTIPPTTCTACYGSGSCKHCGGTGVFRGN